MGRSRRAVAAFTVASLLWFRPASSPSSQGRPAGRSRQVSPRAPTSIMPPAWTSLTSATAAEARPAVASRARRAHSTTRSRFDLAQEFGDAVQLELGGEADASKEVAHYAG
jgi:hypothetical protein